MNARENFHAMMSGGRPEWLPLNVPVTPPVADSDRVAVFQQPRTKRL